MSFRWVENRHDTKRLNIGDDAYIDVANHITGAERLYIQNAGLKGITRERDHLSELMDEGTPGEDGAKSLIQFDAVRQKLARMKVYIKGWNARHDDGTPIKLTQAALESLSEEAMTAIDQALDAHVAKVIEGKASAATTGDQSFLPASISVE